MTTKRIASTTAMALCLAALALPAAAQDAAAGADALYLGRIIIGYTDDGTPIYAGENNTYIEEEELRAAGGTTSLDEILRRQTSVFTQEDPGNPGVAVNIRGFEGSGRVSAMIDGVPQNYRITGHAAQSAVYVDPNFLAGIDITRGAVTTAGGSGIAGSVNFRTINPEDVVQDGKTWGNLVRLSYGDNGQNSSGMISTAYTDSRFGALVALSANNAKDYEDGDGNTVPNTGPNSDSQLLKLSYAISDTQRISFSGMGYSSKFYATSYHQELENRVYTLGYGFDAGDGIWNLDVNLYASSTDVEWVCCGMSTGRQMNTDTRGFNVTNVSELSFGNWDLVSVNGIDWSQDKLGGFRGGVNPTEGKATRAAVFTENIFTSGNWEITAGLRANVYKLEGTVNAGADHLDISHESIDPKLTVAYRVTDWFQPYVTVSKATRSPTLQETMLSGTAHGSGMTGNPDLEPETSKGVELGFNLDGEDIFAAGDRLFGRVNYYRMNVDNYIAASSPFASPVSFVNVPGTSKTNGFEVELDYGIQNWDFGLSYTRNDSDMPSQVPGLGAGQYLPDSTLSLSVAGRFLDDKLTVGGAYSYVSGGLYTALYSIDPVQRDESYELVDLFASYEVNDNFVINAKVNNVFDEAYVPWLSSDEKGRGRSAYIGAELRF